MVVLAPVGCCVPPALCGQVATSPLVPPFCRPPPAHPLNPPALFAQQSAAPSDSWAPRAPGRGGTQRWHHMGGGHPRGGTRSRVQMARGSAGVHTQGRVHTWVLVCRCTRVCGLLHVCARSAVQMGVRGHVSVHTCGGANACAQLQVDACGDTCVQSHTPPCTCIPMSVHTCSGANTRVWPCHCAHASLCWCRSVVV